MAFQLKCFKKFEQFKEKGKTIIFVTHNVADVLKNCNRTIILENGRKTFDGTVKDGVNRYKKIIVGLSSEDIEREEKIKEEIESVSAKIDDSEIWKDKFNQNPNIIEYGNKDADVIDYGIFDLDGNPINVVDNADTVILKSKVKFNKTVKDPIFTMTLKDFKGLEICGTNTVIEKIITGEFKKGDTAITEFRQTFNVAPGKYTLSFSCTHFNHRGDLEVLDRKYDALLVEVMSVKEMVGLLKVNSEVSVTKIPAK